MGFIHLVNKMGEEKNSDDNVRVIVRCRPLNKTEKGDGRKCIVECDEQHGQVRVSKNGQPKMFTFDHVFGDDSRQVDIYNMTARPIVDFVLEGYNGTVFAYGQTGTGKTFTMEGVRSNPELKGIIPNSFAHIFSHISKNPAFKFLIRVSYLEIYCEEIRDLLGVDQTKRLEIKERPDIGVYVKDKKEFAVNTVEDMERIMTSGNKNRQTATTKMNADSSRSHAIFTVTIETMDTGPDGKQRVRAGHLHLVDLAGSERQVKTGATGQTLVEATKINLSLSTLGNVISALIDGKSSFIPYRNSKLTRLLQDSLGGNSKTLMIANFGPADYNYEETISTLRYANRAKNIKNKAVVNEDPKDAMLRQMQEELEQLKKQLVKTGGGSGGSLAPGKALSHNDLSEDLLRQRNNLEKDAEMAEKDKMKALNQLKKKEAEMEQTLKTQNELQSQMATIEQKFIFGGVNLLEKDEEQLELLEASNKEIETKLTQQSEMRKKIVETEVTLDDINKKYTSLQEEAQAKTRKLKKVWTMYNEAKSELADIEAENNRETESMLESIRDLQKSIQLSQMIVHRLVPDQILALIEEHCSWNEPIGEWQLRGIAYTGNNMMKRRSPPPEPANDNTGDNVYLVYNRNGNVDRGGDPGENQEIAGSSSKRKGKSARKKKKNLQNELNQVMQ